MIPGGKLRTKVYSAKELAKKHEHPLALSMKMGSHRSMLLSGFFAAILTAIGISGGMGGCGGGGSPAGDAASFPLTIETSALSIAVEADGGFTLSDSSGAALVASGEAKLARLAGSSGELSDVAFTSMTTGSAEETELGSGSRWTLTGSAIEGTVDVTVDLELYDDFPEGVVVRLDAEADDDEVELSELALLDLDLAGRDSDNTRIFYGPADDTVYWEDYLAIPPVDGYEKSGDMLAGGVPMNLVWGPTGGVGLAVIEGEPTHSALPVSVDGDIVSIRVSYQPQDQYDEETTTPLSSPLAFLTVFQGDFYAPLVTLRELIAQKSGLDFDHDDAPAASWSPLWKTWGLTESFTREEVTAQLDTLQSLGFETVLLDYGWFETEGDWSPATETFDNEAGLVDFIETLHAQGFLVGLWYQPVQVDPEYGFDDWVIEDDSGEPYIDDDDLWLLNPAREEVQDQVIADVEAFVGWGVDYLYIDSQEAQLSAPPDFSDDAPDGPLGGFFALPDLYQMIRETAPDMVIESCPDGRSQTIYQMPFYDVNNAGDPASDLQARLEAKELKALRGAASPVGIYADTYEDNPLSGDLANVIGVGAVPMSLSVFDAESGPQGIDEETWRAWLNYVSAVHPESGTTLNLYDTAFDTPEGHAVSLASGVFQFAFFVRTDPIRIYPGVPPDRDAELTTVLPAEEDASFEGNVTLRGLTPGTTYTLSQAPERENLGSVTAGSDGTADVALSFEGSIVLLAEP